MLNSAHTALVLGGVAHQVRAVQLISQCELFRSNLALLASPYAVETPAAPEAFAQFLDALGGAAVQITEANFVALTRLSREFGFRGLDSELAAFQREGAAAGDLALRIDALEERAHGMDIEVELLHGEVDRAARARAPEAALEARVAALERRAAQPSAEVAQLRQEFRAALARLQAEVWQQLQNYGGWLSLPAGAYAHSAPAHPGPVPGYPPPAAAPPPALDSRIAPDLPAILEEFRGRRFALLYRGSRDGFAARDFHKKCDKRGNTVVLVQESQGFIFGGATPIEWESRVWNKVKGDGSNLWKADDSGKSFLFTIRNPHGLAPRIFPLVFEKRHHALDCDHKWGPVFPGGFAVKDACNTVKDNKADGFGLNYTNNTGLPGDTLLAGQRNFQVKEIEVFQIIA
jgi:hypothetical protein